jgi:hypothetical protein
MRVQLFDRGSPKGKALFSNLEAVCQRLQIDYDPEYIKDMSKVYTMGIQGNTVLLIDNEIVFVDKYPNSKELETIISEYV